MTDVRVRQIWRDMAPDMSARDRQLEILSLDSSTAQCVVVHDLQGMAGRKARIAVRRFNTSAFCLVKDATADETGGALRARLMAALAPVYDARGGVTALTAAALGALAPRPISGETPVRLTAAAITDEQLAQLYAEHAWLSNAVTVLHDGINQTAREAFAQRKLDRARTTAIKAARALHREVDGSPFTEGSCLQCGTNWPCATVDALRAAEVSAPNDTAPVAAG
ncbi:DUF6354 family protein [Streptomyces erythrochromogenes]|uniref:DUF6354 family protein n=1 Tax=Streptomyces erythrochromogenes TaxID=285574 RepID=UPI00342121EC